MKRFALLFALAVMLMLTAQVMASPYSDVPASHWAYDALNKLASTGIITGFPDGTYRGNNNLTRYQIAVLVARILDAVEAENQLLNEKVEAVENGLTAGQAEDVIAIFKSLLAKYAPQQEVKLPESLTATQAEEVAGIVEALCLEFKFELEALGADVDGILERLDAVESRIKPLEVVTWGGSYTADLNKTVITGNGTPYLDPFTQDFDGDDDVDGDDQYAVTDNISHKLELSMNVATDNLTASFDVAAVTDNFIDASPEDADNVTYGDSSFFTLKDLNATVTGDDFTATLAREQALVMVPYLFGLSDDSDVYNGVKLTIGGNEYAIFRTATENVLAAKQGLGLLDATLYFGMNDIIDSKDFVAGINTPFDVLGIDLTTDVAVQKIADEYAPYVTLNAKKSLGALSLEGNYNYIDENFTGLYADITATDGYDARADLALFGDNFKVNGRYWDHSYNKYGFGADATLGGLTANFDMEFAKNDTAEADRTQIGAEYATDILFLNVAAGYKYDQYDDAMDIYVDDDGNPLDEYNRVTGDLTADLFIPGLSATANYVYGLADTDTDGKGLSTHKYGLNYEMGILTAGLEKDMIGDTLKVNATVDPEAYTILGVSVDTAAGFAMKDSAYDYNFGLDLSKQLNDKLTFNCGYLYDNREISSDSYVTGLKIEQTASFDYKITEDLNATLAYTNLFFDDAADTDADSYRVKELTTGLSLEF